MQGLASLGSSIPTYPYRRNYERMAWKRMQDLDRDAPKELTIGEYRRKSLGDLQEVLSH